MQLYVDGAPLGSGKDGEEIDITDRMTDEFKDILYNRTNRYRIEFKDGNTIDLVELNDVVKKALDIAGIKYGEKK